MNNLVILECYLDILPRESERFTSNKKLNSIVIH